jgi:hypothetical protein
MANHGLPIRWKAKLPLVQEFMGAMLMKARYADNRTISTVNNGNLTITEINNQSSDIGDFTKTDAGDTYFSRVSFT